jgi:cobalamin biosynthesis protein CobD/CbiB
VIWINNSPRDSVPDGGWPKGCSATLLILTFSLILNLWGADFGLPELWHPDEFIRPALKMINERTVNPHHFAYGSLHYYEIIVFAGPLAWIAESLFDYEILWTSLA